MPSKSTNALPIPTESEEQQHLFNWARLATGYYPELALMYHIPNEGKRKITTGRRMVAEGLKKGVPDICLPVPRGDYHGLYIEMKRQSGSTPTTDQLDWIENLSRQGYQATWCRGWEAASRVITEYLNQK